MEFLPSETIARIVAAHKGGVLGYLGVLSSKASAKTTTDQFQTAHRYAPANLTAHSAWGSAAVSNDVLENYVASFGTLNLVFLTIKLAIAFLHSLWESAIDTWTI